MIYKFSHVYKHVYKCNGKSKFAWFMGCRVEFKQERKVNFCNSLYMHIMPKTKSIGNIAFCHKDQMEDKSFR